MVRRNLSFVRHSCARRILDLRRQCRPFRFAGDRGRADRLHVDLGHELRASLHRLAAEKPADLRDGHRSEGDARNHRHQRRGRRPLHLAVRRLSEFLDGAATHRLQPRFDRDRLRIRESGLRCLAHVRADGDPDAVLLLREYGIDRRRHQDVPQPGPVPAGGAGNVPPGASAGGHTGENRGPGRRQQDRVCRARVRGAVFRHCRHPDLHAARRAGWTSSVRFRPSSPASTTPALDSASWVLRATTRDSRTSRPGSARWPCCSAASRSSRCSCC